MIDQSVINMVNKLATTRFSVSHREDARQEMLLALIAKDITLDELDAFAFALARQNEGERCRLRQINSSDRKFFTEEDVNRGMMRGHLEFQVNGESVRKKAKYEKAATLYKNGSSVREVQRVVGLSATAAVRYRKLALSNVTVECECGRNAGHKGWCKSRYQKSPKRQAFIQSWRAEKR